ncbi:MAG: hypothetical protein CMC70_08415 [Flavobacteriaceae bacterium]|nr:hypothetical protein [Flavobacteriaceae bacterium]
MLLKSSIFKNNFYAIVFLILIKFTFSYLNVELGWWLRYYQPNIKRFNPLHLPQGMQEYIEYLLIPLMLIHILFNLKRLGVLSVSFLLTFILYGLNLATYFYNDVPFLDSFSYSLKLCSPVYFFLVLIIQYRRNELNIKFVSKIFVWYLLFLAFVALMLFDPSYNRDKYRWPVFFAGLHTHSYVLASVFMAIALFLRKRYWYLYAFMFASLVFLIIGWNVRTAIVMYFIFIAVMLYQSNTFFKEMYAKILVVTPFLVLFIAYIITVVDIDKFSSGRLTMYDDKIELLQEYSTTDFLLGRGIGSDLITTNEWWWEEKGSHNDFLTYIVENGIPFVVLFIVLIFSLLLMSRKVSVFNLWMLVGYLITSMLSNGLATRPLAADIFFIVFVLAYVTRLKDEDEKKLLNA